MFDILMLEAKPPLHVSIVPVSVEHSVISHN